MVKIYDFSFGGVVLKRLKTPHFILLLFFVVLFQWNLLSFTLSLKEKYYDLLSVFRCCYFVPLDIYNTVTRYRENIFYYFSLHQ